MDYRRDNITERRGDRWDNNGGDMWYGKQEAMLPDLNRFLLRVFGLPRSRALFSQDSRAYDDKKRYHASWRALECDFVRLS